MTTTMTLGNNKNMIDSLQGLFNKALSLDEETLAALAKLSGKIIMIEILNTNIQFYLISDVDGIRIESDVEDEPHVRIKSHPGNFIAMLFSGKGESSIPGDMEIIGDVKLVQQFQNIMFEFDPDWEEPVSRLLGDTVTHKLGRFMGKFKKYSAESGQNLLMDISEYLRFEKKMIPDVTELEDFNNQVDEIRSATDRLEKRLEKLEGLIQQNGTVK